MITATPEETASDAGSTRITAYVPVPLKTEFRIFALKQGITLSTALETALDEYLDARNPDRRKGTKQ